MRLSTARMFVTLSLSKFLLPTLSSSSRRDKKGMFLNICLTSSISSVYVFLSMKSKYVTKIKSKERGTGKKFLLNFSFYCVSLSCAFENPLMKTIIKKWRKIAKRKKVCFFLLYKVEICMEHKSFLSFSGSLSLCGEIKAHL